MRSLTTSAASHCIWVGIAYPCRLLQYKTILITFTLFEIMHFSNIIINIKLPRVCFRLVAGSPEMSDRHTLVEPVAVRWVTTCVSKCSGLSQNLARAQPKFPNPLDFSGFFLGGSRTWDSLRNFRTHYDYATTGLFC